MLVLARSAARCLRQSVCTVKLKLELVIILAKAAAA